MRSGVANSPAGAAGRRALLLSRVRCGRMRHATFPAAAGTCPRAARPQVHMLQRLVHPVGLSHFMSTYFGEAWFLAPHSSSQDNQVAAWISSLFSLQDMADLLSLQHHGRPIALPQLVRRGGSGDAAGAMAVATDLSVKVSDAILEISDPAMALAEVQRAFAAGHSAFFQGLEKSSPTIRNISGALSCELGLPVSVDALLEPPRLGQGLGSTDGNVASKGAGGATSPCPTWASLVLQTHGRRTWYLAGNRTWSSAKVDLGRGATAVTLRAGDVLYLPSHLAFCADGPPAGAEPSFHVHFRILEERFTWAALVSLVCQCIGGPRPPTVSGGGADGADASVAGTHSGNLDEVLMCEAARIEGLGRLLARPPSAHGIADPFSMLLPAVLQYAVSVPGDLPPGWVDSLLQQLMRLLARLHAVGHLDRLVNIESRNGVDMLCARVLVDSAHNAGEEALRAALLLALGELRRRGAPSDAGAATGGGRLHSCGGSQVGIVAAEAFSSLARICETRGGVHQRGGGFAGLRFARAQAARPLLRRRHDGSAEELLGLGSASVPMGVPAELGEAVEWCLGQWTGAGGLPFRLTSVPGEPDVAHGAVVFLLELGALEVVDDL